MLQWVLDIPDLVDLADLVGRADRVGRQHQEPWALAERWVELIPDQADQVGRADRVGQVGQVVLTWAVEVETLLRVISPQRAKVRKAS